MNDVQVQVIRGSQLIRESLFFDTLPETYLMVELPNGRTRAFKAPAEPNETIMYGVEDCHIVIRSTSRRCLFLAHILNDQGEQLAKGNFRRLSEAESWAFRTMAEQQLFHPKATLRADITPLSEKEAEAFLSVDEAKEEHMLDEV